MSPLAYIYAPVGAGRRWKLGLTVTGRDSGTAFQRIGNEYASEADANKAARDHYAKVERMARLRDDARPSSFHLT